jgi:cytochrome bd-type quinol oxidase subunit 2
MYRLLRSSIMIAYLMLFFCISGGVKVNAEAISTSDGLSSSRLNLASLIGSQSVNEACQGVDLSNTGGCPTTSGDSIDHILSIILNILSVMVGIVAVIMIIVGGLKFITSGGEASKAAAARNTLIYAIVGILVAVLAQVLVHFVLNKAENAAGTAPPAPIKSACVNSPSCV